MIRLERTIRTQASAEAVYAFLSDFTTTNQWDPATVDTTLLTGDGGVGSTYRNISKLAGRKAEVLYTLTRLEAPRVVELRGENKTLVAHDRMEISPAAGGTEVTYRATFEMKGRLARLLEPLLRLPMKKLGDDGQRGMTAALARL